MRCKIITKPDKEKEKFLVKRNKTKLIELSLNECIYLDDCFTLLLQRADFNDLTSARPTTQTAVLPVSIELVKKIGIAFNFLINHKDKSTIATVELNEIELLMLRELSQSYVRISEENVGINLKRKVFNLLLEDLDKKENKNKHFGFWVENIKNENWKN